MDTLLRDIVVLVASAYLSLRFLSTVQRAHEKLRDELDDIRQTISRIESERQNDAQ